MEELDATPIINDPLKDFNFDDVDESYKNDEDMPEELQQLFQEFDLGKIKYRVQLKQYPDPELSTTEYIKSFSNTIPTVDWIALNYGPGKYVYNVHFKRKDPETGVYKNRCREYEFTISNAFAPQYEEFQMQRRISRMQKEKDIIRKVRHNANLEKAFQGETEKNTQTPKEYLLELTNTAKELGLINNNNSGSGMASLADMLKGLLPLAPALITALGEKARAQAERQDKMLMIMLQQQNKASEQMVELMKGIKGPTSGTDQMKEVRDMIFSAIDIKQTLNADKETIADRIFNLAQGVLPQILSIAQMSQSQKQISPQYLLAKNFIDNNPDMQAMKENPAIRQDVINKFDAEFGEEQTNIILQVAGIPRTAPEQSPEQEQTEAGAETETSQTTNQE